MRITSQTLRYSPQIDGIRALAVLAVVLYHIGLGCSGGYVGVDVFFVLSGFLITSLIWTDLENGKFSFGMFWERRVRRILPPLFVVTLVTLIVGCIFLLPSDLIRLGHAVIAQSFFQANRFYFSSDNYFNNLSSEKPLLHTWSLAVEEQFYFIMPFVLWAIFRVKRACKRKPLIAMLFCLILISFALSVHYVVYRPQFAFYMLPTRAWELLVGSVVAFLPTVAGNSRQKVLGELLNITGLLAIIIPIFTYSTTTPFPGMGALPPCLGTALIIWTNERYCIANPSLLGRFLSVYPVVFVGKISYSLYLWHWPIIAFSNYMSYNPLIPAAKITILSASISLSILSYYWIERPFRQRWLGKTRKGVFGYAAIGTLIILIVGKVLITSNGLPVRISSQSLEFSRDIVDFEQPQQTLQDILNDNLVVFGAGGANIHPTVLVWGDSHAMAALPAFDTFLKERGIAGRVATHPATAPVLDWFINSPYGLRGDAPAYNRAVISYIKRHGIRDVILVALWHSYATDPNQNANMFGLDLLKTVKAIHNMGAQPWIVLDDPIQPFDISRALSRSLIRDTQLNRFCARVYGYEPFDSIDPKIIIEMKSYGAIIIDPKPGFMDSTHQFYTVYADHTLLYLDSNHLSRKGAIKVITPILREQLHLSSPRK